jgi:hypothetical protein
MGGFLRKLGWLIRQRAREAELNEAWACAC